MIPRIDASIGRRGHDANTCRGSVGDMQETGQDEFSCLDNAQSCAVDSLAAGLMFFSMPD